MDRPYLPVICRRVAISCDILSKRLKSGTFEPGRHEILFAGHLLLHIYA